MCVTVDAGLFLAPSDLTQCFRGNKGHFFTLDMMLRLDIELLDWFLTLLNAP